MLRFERKAWKRFLQSSHSKTMYSKYRTKSCSLDLFRLWNKGLMSFFESQLSEHLPNIGSSHCNRLRNFTFQNIYEARNSVPDPTTFSMQCKYSFSASFISHKNSMKAQGSHRCNFASAVQINVIFCIAQTGLDTSDQRQLNPREL